MKNSKMELIKKALKKRLGDFALGSTDLPKLPTLISSHSSIMRKKFTSKMSLDQFQVLQRKRTVIGHNVSLEAQESSDFSVDHRSDF